MKPFDSKLAMQGNPVVNRATRNVRVLCIDAPGSQPVIVVDDTGYITRNNIDGSFASQDIKHDYDLFMKPVKRTAYITKSNLDYLSLETIQDVLRHGKEAVLVEWEE
jgi:hypothetical protein